MRHTEKGGRKFESKIGQEPRSAFTGGGFLDCQSQISTIAYECPHCGRPHRKRPRLVVLDLALGVLFGILVAAIILFLADIALVHF
jgi:hypothetical protein